jgi:hypothetical protein
MQWQDVRMHQARGDIDLPKKALWSHERGEFRAKNLDRHSAMVPQVMSQRNHGHGARPELTLDLVALSYSPGQPSNGRV